MAAGKGRKLVIVESPAKVKSIAGYLGGDYEVEASIGHIRDLPNPSELPADMKKGPYGKFAVDVDNGFDPYYVVDSGQEEEGRRAASASSRTPDELYLATDEDREGEAIAWHLLEALQPACRSSGWSSTRSPRRRSSGRSTTPARSTRRLVDAQETRRILDRLYGYEVSPVLWRKVRQGLSAGRVQSVATRMVVERERERMAFVRASYWDVEGDFTPGGAGQQFTARLIARRRQRGRHRARLRRHGRADRSQRGARRRGRWPTASRRPVARRTARVTDVQEKPYTRRPSAPFTTSTLQQEASRKLRLSAARTPCGWPSASTRAATSPTCAPTRPRCRRPRSPRPAARRATCTAPSTCPTARAATRRRSRTRRRRTRRCARPVTGSGRPPRSPESCAARSSRSTS